MAGHIDLHLGKRLRRRRRLLGLTQQQLASAVGVRFQQIQKYECGANRISAARLWNWRGALSARSTTSTRALRPKPPPHRQRRGKRSEQVLARKDNDLVRAYYRLGERPRRRLLDLAKSLDDNDAA